MRIRHIPVLLGTVVAFKATTASAQGIALPATPSPEGRAAQAAAVQVSRTETVRLNARGLRGAGAQALSVADTVWVEAEAYEVKRFEDDTVAVASRTVLADVPTFRVAAESACSLERGLQGLPVLNRAQAQCFWGQTGTETLKYATLSGAGDARSVTIDLVSDLIGPVRAYVTASVAAADDEGERGEQQAQADQPSDSEVDANTQRFLTNGGNAVLGLLFPGPTFRTTSSIGQTSPDFMAYALFAPRIGFDVPQANTTSTNAKVNVDVGPEITLAARGEQLALFSQLRMAYVVGSPEFYQGLGQETNRPFGYSRANVGLSLRLLGETNILVSWSKPILGPDQLFDSGSQLHFSVQKVQPNTGQR